VTAPRLHLMCSVLASDVVRTTLDIETPILLELKRLQKKERKSMGQLASELIAFALKARRGGAQRAVETEANWIARPLGPAKVDLLDKEALAAVTDADDGWPRR
jgi:hypothetical protein